VTFSNPKFARSMPHNLANLGFGTPVIRGAGARRADRSRGFSLIELLVAMTIVSLALVAVSPALMAGLDRASVYAAKGDFESQIRDLRWEAVKRQTPIVIAEPAAGGASPIVMPPGFRYRLSAPIVIEATGHCSGGLVRVEKSPRVGVDFRLAAPRCLSTGLRSGGRS
jgi:prepilin-type N-terminal cleavage/methylation domain-containing protein